jgi:stress-induced morphogen
MPMPAAEIEQLVKNAIPDAKIHLVDTAGDNDHYSITVESAAFAGKSRIEQHRIVMAAIGDNMGGRLHALSITTKVV